MGSTSRGVRTCGDSLVSGSEVCDGTALAGADCAGMGFLDGTLACAADCSGYDTSGCTDYYEFCSSTSLTIPDNDTTGITQDISVATSATIDDVDVYLDVSHTWLNDLNFDITKDGGTNVLLVDGFLDQGNNSCGGDDMQALLDDDATTSIVNACDESVTPSIDGTFAPEGSLSDFDGGDMAGTWTIHVYDQFNQDTGQINQWCVRVYPL